MMATSPNVIRKPKVSEAIRERLAACRPQASKPERSIPGGHQPST
ncbi:hypothetical protein [Rubripirellula lacrimiformis]|nr:hypothetical protein [Rubripirellula lacrimiformis]